MAQLTAAVVGTGPEPENKDWGTSAAMGYDHGRAYRDLDGVSLVACADIAPENAEAFADVFGCTAYTDAIDMLIDADPDIVSVATPVPTHADLVVDIVKTGVPDAVHCEKPMADTLAGARQMADVAEDAGVQLTFNHQRRFAAPWRRARELLDDGQIGRLERVEVGGKNLFDYGTHLIDLAHSYNGERPASWVLAGLDYTDADVRYGSHNENQAVALWGYDNGVHGLALTASGEGSDAAPYHHRLVGTKGIVEVLPETNEAGDADVRYFAPDTDGWVGELAEMDGSAITRCVAHVLNCLRGGVEPEVSHRAALRATETIFAAWESSRVRARMTVPIDTAGNPLAEMVESGALDPE